MTNEESVSVTSRNNEVTSEIVLNEMTKTEVNTREFASQFQYTVDKLNDCNFF